MSFLYIQPGYSQFPLIYWSCFTPEFRYQNASEKPLSNENIKNQEPAVKIQGSADVKLENKVLKTAKINKKASRKKRKVRKTKKRDTNFSGKSQKENRNYNSIICRMFLLYLGQHYHIQNLIKPVIQHFGVSITVESFLKTFHYLFDLKKSYVRKELIDAVCASKICSSQFSLIFRVLFRKFLKLQVFPTVFKSSKLNKKVKVREAKFARTVYETYFETQRQTENQKSYLTQQNQKSPLYKACSNLKIQNTSQVPDN